ncbi:hypothetical protein Pcinc_030434 [Petrolisthes cinctipes]|uniref:Transmembrane protein 26 n=1 Tax=Petrolisthes cinctipes TaxID=88211 RepID=A0AAE1EYV6_PETCI|nr:hypothetical protein Pcinc_030434 [Petrolisthes cinctipes]
MFCQIKAIVTRVLFATHAFIAVWVLVHINGERDVWFLLAPLMFQGFEGIVSICARNGEEMKWFCPSVFLYLVSVVPPIWLMELALKDLRVESPTQAFNATRLPHAQVKVFGMSVESEHCVRVLEQVLLVMLLMGRWLLPKGKLTREQLSQLLLAYMAMAADIIELFECFKEDAVAKNTELIYATLGIWSWSLLQFTLVLSATHAPKPRPSINYPPPQEVTLEDTALLTYCDADGLKKGTNKTTHYDADTLKKGTKTTHYDADNLKKGTKTTHYDADNLKKGTKITYCDTDSLKKGTNKTTHYDTDSLKKGTKTTHYDADSLKKGTKSTCAYNINIYLDMDIIAILTTVFMQDGPFFLLRMTLIFGYKVVSYLNIFFTCKNTLVVSLQLYRLFVLCSRKRVLNRKRKELLLQQSSPTNEGSEDLQDTTNERTDVNHLDENSPSTSPSIQNSLPVPPILPAMYPVIASQPINLSTDPNLEESLLEIIEQLGEESVIRELENLIEHPPSEGPQEAPSPVRLEEEPESQSRSISKLGEEDDYSPPDSGIHNSSSFPLNSRKTTKRHYSVSKRNKDYLKRMQEGVGEGYRDVSDCGSYSDTDIHIDNYNNPDQSGISVSSNSLQVDPYQTTNNSAGQHGWGLIRERCLTSGHTRHGSNSNGGPRGVSSVPVKPHRESRRSLPLSNVSSLTHHQRSYSPVPQHRDRHSGPVPGSVRGREGSRRICPSGGTKGEGGVGVGVGVRRHHSVNLYDHVPIRYSGISESDADTMETNV